MARRFPPSRESPFCAWQALAHVPCNPILLLEVIGELPLLFDPVTYVVYPMRHAVFSHLNIAPAAGAALFPSVTWGGRSVPVGISLGIVAVMGAALPLMDIAEFQRVE